MAKSKTAGGPKTVRFSRLVERSGQPRPHTLWLSPDDDLELKRAVAAHRVLTIEPGTGSGKTDLGRVGFDASRTRGAQILIFPKSLKAFQGTRVVGIKFDLVEQPKLEVARSPATVRPRLRGRKSKTKPPAPPTEPAQPKKPEVARPETPPPPTSDEPRSRDSGTLEEQVRAAIKELEAGQAVAAYRRLQRAVS